MYYKLVVSRFLTAAGTYHDRCDGEAEPRTMITNVVLMRVRSLIVSSSSNKSQLQSKLFKKFRPKDIHNIKLTQLVAVVQKRDGGGSVSKKPFAFGTPHRKHHTSPTITQTMSTLALPTEIWIRVLESLRTENVELWMSMRHVSRGFKDAVETIFRDKHLPKTFIDIDLGKHLERYMQPS